MFALRRSEENELERNFLPVRFANRVQHRLVSEGAYHLARKSGIFGLKSNGEVILRKFHSEIVEYLLFFHSERNGGNFLTIC